MRKDKLIALLEAIEGNPEILLWNGMVGDWMDISEAVEGRLVKRTLKDHMTGFKRGDEKIAQRTYRNLQWESNEFVTNEDIKNKFYKKKKVVYLDAKPRNVKTWDRLGSISY
jgi:hypothetical protein